MVEVETFKELMFERVVHPDGIGGHSVFREKCSFVHLKTGQYLDQLYQGGTNELPNELLLLNH